MIHDDLLELAEHLAGREARRPKQISLGRAISAAYYAVFHALAYLCADELVGWRNEWKFVTPIYRAIEHSTAKRVFERDREGTTYGGDVAKIGQTFILLQEKRHAADYNPEFSSARRETLELIGMARKAVQSMLSLNAETRRLLAVHLIGRQR